MIVAYDEKLAERIEALLLPRRKYPAKKMFGGIAYFLKGNLCVGIYKDKLIVRLDPTTMFDLLKKPHTHPFDITGRPMRGWIMVEPAGLKRSASLKFWIQQALSYVSKLPKK